MRGNLVELAVAVVIGTQFSSLVKQFVSSFVNPLLSLAGGTPDFGNLTFKAGKAVFSYGQFVTAALSFLISALVVYFILVLPVSRLLRLLERNKAATTRDCPECMMSIPVAARRCPACTTRPWFEPGCAVATAVPAGRAADMRRLRAADGIGVVQRQGRLPVPPRPHHREQARPGSGQERLHP
jgi:large conductance mechanosensitive channel